MNNNNRENDFHKNQKDYLGRKRDFPHEQNNRNPSHENKNDQSANANNYYNSSSNRSKSDNFTKNLNEKSCSPPINRKNPNEGDMRHNDDYSSRNYNAANYNTNNPREEFNFSNNNNNNNYERNSSKNFSKNFSNNHNNNNNNFSNGRNNYNNFKSSNNSINQNQNLNNVKYNSNSNPNSNFSNNNNNRPRNQNNSSQARKPRNDEIRISYYGLENLPIMNHKAEIMNLLATEQVIIISGTTGCGKTTQVPKFIYEKLKQDFPDIFELDNQGQKKHYRKILITQPRRIAAVSIAKRLCQELKCELGKEVGYHVGLNPNYNSDTRIVICTTGIFLQKIINDDSFKEYAYVVIDEVHERDADIDLLLVMLKHLIAKNRKVKLILMSATISIKLFSGYFGKDAVSNVRKTDVYEQLGIDKALKFEERKDFWNNPMERDKVFHEKLIQIIDQQANKADAAKVVEIKMKIFEVQIFYMEFIEQKLKGDYGNIMQFQSFLGYIPGSLLSNPLLDKSLYGVAFLIILQIIEGYLGDDENNSILVFLPGINEIQELEKTIRNGLADYNPQLLSAIKICPLHSAISDEEQQQIFNFTPERKIIISTNIAESSITIPDTKYVIDFCLVKELKHSTYNDTESLELTWSSKASCDQRKGRAGRVSDGFCFRLVKKTFYESEMESSSRAELLRIPLEKTILRLKVWNKGEPGDILGRCIEPPNIKLVNLAIHNLQNYGALTLDSVQSATGVLTQLGKIYSILPLEIKHSRLIILGYAFNLMEPAIILAAILTQEKSIFRINSNNSVDFYDKKVYYSAGTECDFITAYYAYVEWFTKFYRDYKFNTNNRIPYQEMEEEKKEAENLKLNYYVVKEVKVLSFDILKRMKKLNYLKTEELGFNVKKLNLKGKEDEVFFLKVVFAGAFYGKIMKATYANFEMLKKRMQDKDKYVVRDSLGYHAAENESGKEGKVVLENCMFLRSWDNDINYSKELASLIKSIFGFDALINITNRFSEYLIEFNEKNTETNKRLIQKLLNMSSPMRQKENIFSLTESKKSSSSKGSTYTFQTKLPKPEHPYEIRLTDIFHTRQVECEVNSINHAVIEPSKKKLQNSFYVSDNFYCRNNRYVCRYASKLPEIPMLDKLLILIFTPTAKFWPFNLNDPDENERYGYSHFKTFGCSSEFNFSHSFCSQDVLVLNKIRSKINEIVFGLYDNERYETEANKLREHTKRLLTKKRFKVITHPDWWRIYCFYFKDEFEKIKNGLRFFDDEEMQISKDKDGNVIEEDGFCFKKYLKEKNPQEYFRKNNFSDFYSQKLKIDYKARNAEEYEDFEDNGCKNNSSGSDDSSSSDSDDSSDSESKLKKRNKNEKGKVKVEVKEENAQQLNVNNEKNDFNEDICKMDIEGEDSLAVKNININNTNKKESNFKAEGELKKKSNNNLFEATEKHYLESLATTFLPELERLQNKEDNRLLTIDGEAELAAERLKFSQMRQKLFKDFEDLNKLCSQGNPFIECIKCQNFICNVSNLKPWGNAQHKVTGWLDPFINEIELDDLNFHDGFINDILSVLETTTSNKNALNNKEAKKGKFISCREASHVFGFKNQQGDSFILDNSPVRIVFPCGKAEQFNGFWAQSNYEQIFIQNVNSIEERNRLIRIKAKCLLCNVNFENLKTIKDIDAKRKDHFEKDKFHKEMVKEFVEEDFE